MVIRRALLIAASKVPGQEELPGATEDTNLWTEYLTSPIGGSWNYPNEILCLDNPNPNELSNALKWASEGTFAFVTFSGHGGTDTETNKPLALMGNIRGRNWFVPIADLKPPVYRRVLVVDACRTPLPVLEEAQKSLKALMEKTAAVEPDAALCRQLFDNLIAKAEEGESILYACSPNQEAGDSVDGSGGYFTKALIECAIKWGRAVLSTPGRTNWLSIPVAFRLAKGTLESEDVIQTPHLVNGRRLNQFPFTVVARRENFPFGVVGWGQALLG